MNLLIILKFVAWVEDWKSSGENGLSADTFRTLTQTSKNFPLLVNFHLEEKEITCDPRFGRYRQLSGAERQFLEGEKAI